MAEIRSLDGKVLKSDEPPEKNAEVGELLRQCLDEYKKGEVQFIGLVRVRPNGATRTDWAWGDESFGQGFPWYLAMAGALSALVDDFHATARDTANRTTETGAPDAS